MHCVVVLAGFVGLVTHLPAGVVAAGLWHRHYHAKVRRIYPGYAPRVDPGWAATLVVTGWLGLLAAGLQIALDPDPR